MINEHLESNIENLVTIAYFPYITPKGPRFESQPRNLSNSNPMLTWGVMSTLETNLPGLLGSTWALLLRFSGGADMERTLRCCWGFSMLCCCWPMSTVLRSPCWGICCCWADAACLGPGCCWASGGSGSPLLPLLPCELVPLACERTSCGSNVRFMMCWFWSAVVLLTFSWIFSKVFRFCID